MSQTGQNSAAHLTDAFPVNLTVVVLLLLPCVLLLLLLNCVFLVYKLLILSRSRRRRRREDAEEVLLRSALPRVRLSDAAFSPLQDAGRAYVSVSEPVLSHPVTSSRASSRERLGVNHRIRLLRPDGTTGSGSLRAPSSIRAASSAFSPRLEAPWSRSEPVLTRSSGSETETRVNLVPPNSPTMEHMGHIRRSSTREKLSEAAVHPFDKVIAECESTEPTDTSCLNTTTVGPGLDSDFGASAGVSLRILSADSDGLSNGVLASALEWDYYDPCYVKQNNIPKHKHPIPAIHTRQYWV
ncbi:protein huluwa isoform X1 [Oryzias melastigma]|uniref:protein huluwa isoform X1 n=1 Tax=Oryzias melastigma TaxID=30732 RepID=UPI000CF7C3A8|nr:protein huluwa isoform X1 [Oryzias melastigma]XP_036070389.1 protein huluwa isoform X1 [Oryzias melastigma]